MKPKHAFIALKFSVSITLMVYLLKFDLIDVNRILSIEPVLLFLGLNLLFIQFILSVFRWKMLLSSQFIERSFFSVFQFSLVGMFFSLFLPGSVGGDLIKALYITRFSPKNRLAAISTVVVDRWIGLIALFYVSFFSFTVLWFINPDVIVENGFLGLMWSITSSICVAIAFIGFVAVNRQIFNKTIKSRFSSSFNPHINTFLEILAIYCNQPKLLLRTFFLSLVIQMITPILFVILAASLNQDGIPWYLIFLFAPMVMVTNAIPISVMGLGVGETAMITLLGLVLPESVPNKGGELMLLFRLLTMLLSLPGGVLLWFIGKSDDPKVDDPSSMPTIADSSYESRLL